MDGWWHNHSFSFANWYNPERVHFGALRVLNDDYIAPNRGFGTHPHENMEIISIPLVGDLSHETAWGIPRLFVKEIYRSLVLELGFITVKRINESINKLITAIVDFPNKQNVTPRYDQISIRDLKRK